MQRLFYLYGLLLAGCTAVAQNNLRIVSPNGLLFTAVTNDHPKSEPQTELLLKGVDRDTLSIEIVVEGNAVITQTVYLLDQGRPCTGQEINYSLRKAGKGFTLRYEGIYPATVLPDPLVPQPVKPDTTKAWRNRYMGHLCEMKDGTPVYLNNLPAGRCTSPMPDSYMDYIKVLMGKAQTEDGRLSVAENVCQNNCLSTAQLSALLNYVGYEIERLKLLKLAYPHLTDSAAARGLEKNFTFAAARRELLQFLDHPNQEQVVTTSACVNAADSAAIAPFGAALGNCSNDGERLETFKKGYRAHCYTTAQIRALLQLFIHDREKGIAAQALYFYCVDKGNYVTLTTLFNYNESKNALLNFVEKQNK